MTDAAFMLGMLRERPGEWVPQMAIINRSLDKRGCGITPHSRAAELRAQGWTVENKVEHVNGRRKSFYRLCSLESAAQPQTARESEASNMGSAEAADSSEADRGKDLALF